ncbi:methyl-accepting chemotaxis protein [Anaerovorax sp. IOR16]|uniref:methyl-accepting chemotaxis protein n=1 Tax=Anaerovorax sp. IOR16 TaxID=2773458 RepID=UPI0019D1CEB5|nr:methyl-accepting chemotaxis protein [Anaerovorax sp. IOR16]
MKKKFGIKQNLLISISLLLSISLIAIAITGYIIFQKELLQHSELQVKETIAKYGEELDAWLLYQGTFAQNYSNAFSQFEALSIGHEQNSEYLKKIFSTNSDLMDCYTGYENKEMYVAENPVSQDYDCTIRDWYKAAKEKMNVIYTEPYIDASTDKMVITVAAPILKDNEFVGVFGLDIDVNALTTIASGIKIYNNGYPVLFDDKNNIIIHKDSELIPFVDNSGNEHKTNISEIKGDYQSMLDSLEVGLAIFKEGQDMDGSNVIFGFTKLKTTPWILGYIIPNSEYYHALNNLKYINLILVLLFLIIGNVIMWYLLIKNLKPLQKISGLASEMAKGNLNIDFTHDANDEIGTLCNALNFSSKSISGYVSEISNILEKLSNGDFRVSTTKEYIGDFKSIEKSIKRFISNISNTFLQINQASDQVSSGSKQVSLGSQALSQGAMEQASSIQELSATITEISEQVQNNADNAKNVNVQVTNQGSRVGKCNKQMDELTVAISDISHRSNEIGKIIKTIDDIAFQTNILALNAAVEASRAGAAGKGFAVVADEVRNLASKSAEAAQNTTMLIGETVKAVENGTKIASETAQSMSEVVNGASKVVSIIGEIAQASEVQALAISKVTLGVDQVSSVVQTNSATAEESAAASEELSVQAQLLKDLVAKVQFNENTGADFSDLEK